MKLVENLQRLFAFLVRSDRRYLDPTPVLSTLVDDEGKQISIGDEKDVGEFNMLLISRIEDGLKGVRRERPSDSLPRASVDFSSIQRKESFALVDETDVTQSIVSKLFYGLQQEDTFYLESDGSHTEHKDVVFGQFILHVENKDLYAAWDKAMSAKIEGYESPLGTKVMADHDTWITKAPQVLLFQISRVDYDKKSQTPVKNHKKFTFPKVLYPDRFLMENKQLSTELRFKMGKLTKKIEKLERVLEQFEKFKDSQAPIHQILALAGAFVSNQSAPNEYMETEDPSLHVYNPGRLEPSVSATPAQLADAENLFKAFATRTESMIASMRQQLKDCNQQILSMFDITELTKHPYQLHSILIHDGQAGSGHYFACIFEPETGIWRRYSDINVTDISEEDVMLEAFGGHHYASAYCLMYLDTRLKQVNPSGTMLRSHRLASVLDQHLFNDLYNSYVPNHLVAEVDEDNQKLKSEIIEWKASNTSRAVHEAYQVRNTQATTQWQSFRGGATETIKHELINLAVSLKIKGEDQLSNWFILDTCVRDCDEEHRSLKDLKADDPLYRKILGLSFKPRISLYPEEHLKLSSFLNDFESNYRCALVDEFIMRKMNIYSYKEAFFGIMYLLSQSLVEKTIFQSMPRDLAKILALHLCSKINETVYLKDFRRTGELVGIVAMLATMYLDVGYTHFTQVERSLKWTSDYLQRNCADEFVGEFKDTFQKAFESVASQDFAPFFDLAETIQELEEITQQAKSFNGNVWIEGWKSNMVPSRWAQEWQRLRKNYEVWHQWHNQLLTTRMALTDVQRLELEQRANIHPR